jgi:hypothetical protein
MTTMRARLTAAVLVAMALGCGSDGGSGVDGSKSLEALDDADKGALCDWLNGKLGGGYDKPIVCGGETIDHTDDSQAECVQDFPACAVTVAQFEACLGRLIDTKCDEAAQQQAAASADCVSVTDCL